MCSGVFIVEDIESRQADVRDFFLTESNYRCRVLRRCIACWTNGCPRCAARQRQRPSDSQYRYGFRPTPSFRSLLRVRHSGDLPYKLRWGGPSQTDCSKSAPPALLPSRGAAREGIQSFAAETNYQPSVCRICLSSCVSCVVFVAYM